MSILWRIGIFIKTALRPVGTSVAGTRRSVSARTLKREIFRAIRGALSSKWTFTVIITLKRHLAFVRKRTVKFYFFAYRRLIFADSLSYVRLNTTVVEVEINERLKSTLPYSKWK